MKPMTVNRRAALQGLAGLALSAGAARAATEDDFSFVALGDWGRGGHREQVAVAQAMGRTAAEISSRFVLSVGDNFYPMGVQSTDDRQWKSSFEEVYRHPALQTPWYAALGNHDYRGKPAAQIAYSATSPRWRMPARSYKLSGADLGQPKLDVFVLDTTPLTGGDGEALVRLSRGHVSMPSPDCQIAWLGDQLARSNAPWKLVVGHHPIHSGGHHGGSAELTTSIEPLLERYGVQGYLCGHDHSLQHVRVGRTHHICTGAGSSAGEVVPIKGTLFAASQPGFAALRMRGDTLSLEFHGQDGAVIYAAKLPQA